MRKYFILTLKTVLFSILLLMFSETADGQQVLLQNKRNMLSGWPRSTNVNHRKIDPMIDRHVRDSSAPNEKSYNYLDSLTRARNAAPANDTAALDAFNALIDSVKNENLLEFITSLKKPTPYSVFHIGKYNIDSVNTFLYNQGRFGALQSIALQNYSNSTVVSGELASAFIGPIRLGIGGAFNTTGDTAQDNAVKSSLQKILNNGGQISTTFNLPLYYLRSRKDNFHFGVFAHTVFGFSPGFDSVSNQTNYSNAFLFSNKSGFNFHIDGGASDYAGCIYIDLPVDYVWGNYYKNMGQTDFGVVNLQAGIVLKGSVNLSVSGPLFSTSSKVQRLPFILSLQFSPSQIVAGQ